MPNRAGGDPGAPPGRIAGTRAGPPAS